MPSKFVQLRREITDRFFTGLAAGLSVVVIGALVAILAYLVLRGAGSLNWAFFTEIQKPVGESGGGMANGIVGSIMILAIASCIGVPLGIGAGVYLAEFGRGRLGKLVRFTADVLNGVPSIVIGMVAWGLVVVQQKHFSAFAGGVALAIMMIPTVTRATEEMLLLVPQSVREAAFGLGIPQWRTTVSITLPSARAGILTGVMLAFARIAGETAPLLFTAFGNQFWNLSPSQPIAAMPLQIYTYALSPYDEWHRQAWAGALVLVLLIVGTTTLVRFVFLRRMLGGAR
jgi:phosphate transport system permease protein